MNKIYLVNYFKNDDFDHQTERENFVFNNEQAARNKYKELVSEAMDEIVNDCLWEGCNSDSCYETVEELMDDRDVDLENDTCFEWYEGCGYSELSIDIKETEVQ